MWDSVPGIARVCVRVFSCAERKEGHVMVRMHYIKGSISLLQAVVLIRLKPNVNTVEIDRCYTVMIVVLIAGVAE